MTSSDTTAKHPKRGVYLVISAFLALAVLGTACAEGESDAEKPVIRLHDIQSESQWLNNAIAKFIIEEGYGYPVETVVESTPQMQDALRNGEIDVNLEGWQQNILKWYEEAIAAKDILNLGAIYEASSQVFVIPAWVAETYEISTVSDMKDHWKLFTDPNDSSKGVFYNCIAGWECANINRAKLGAYGLSEYYNAVSPASSAALDSALTEPQKARKPVFGYYWTPAALMVSYDWHVLQEPPYGEDCWRQVLLAAGGDGATTPTQGCAYESIPIDKLANAGLRDKAPDVFAMIDKMVVGLDPLNSTVAWAIQNSVEDWDQAALHYLRTYDARWRTWVTPDAYDKIDAALQKGL